MMRLDVKSGTFENLGVAKDVNGKGIGAYGIPTDQTNGSICSISAAAIRAARRRDAQDDDLSHAHAGLAPASRLGSMRERLWCRRICRQRHRHVRSQDPKFIKESTTFPGPAPTTWCRGKTAWLWTASMLTDRATRLDPATGATVDYPLPHQTNIRRVFVDQTARCVRQRPQRRDRQVERRTSPAIAGLAAIMRPRARMPVPRRRERGGVERLDEAPLRHDDEAGTSCATTARAWSQQIGQAALAPQPLQQLDQLRLRQHVQRRGRLRRAAAGAARAQCRAIATRWRCPPRKLMRETIAENLIEPDCC